MAKIRLWTFLFLCLLVLINAESKRRKRALTDMAGLVQCATQLPSKWAVFSSYNCYGCYCGFAGTGEPVDEIDRCCKEHDACYGRLNEKRCTWWLGQVYWHSYEFECVQGSVDLPTALGTKSNYTPRCTSASSDCARGACDCDVIYGNCLRQYKVGEKKKCPRWRLLPSCLLNVFGS